MQQMFNRIFELINGRSSLGFPRRVLIDELLSKVMRDTLDATLQTLVAGRLARSNEAFDLVSLTLRTWATSQHDPCH